MNGTKQRHKHKIKWLLASITLFCTNVFATSLQTHYQFDLKQQPLIDALQKATERTKLQLLLPHAALEKLTSVAVKGDMSLDDVLKILLKNHHLEYLLLSQNMLVIRQIRTPIKAVKTIEKPLKKQFTSKKSTKKPSLEIVSISGYRTSMAKSLFEKHNATVISDVITQEEIGKFPDSNVAESMQRLSGVTLDRGEYISIRGADPQMSRVQINGRSIGTTSASNRDVSFSIFGSELFQMIKVIKSTSADMDVGGIGGVISLETPKPLSIGKRTFGIEMGANRTSTAEQFSPEYSLYFNDLMFDDTVGVYVSFSQQHSKLTEQFGQVKAWQTVDLAAPQVLANMDMVGGIKQQITTTKQQRDNRYVSIQWQVNDSIQVYADHLHSTNKPEIVKDIFETENSKTDSLADHDLTHQPTHEQSVITSARFSDVDVFQTTRLDSIDYFQKGGSFRVQWTLDRWLFNSAAFVTESGRNQNMKLARAQANVDLGYNLNVQDQMPLIVDVESPVWQFNKTQHQFTHTNDQETALEFDAEHDLDNDVFSQLIFGIKQKRRIKRRDRKNKEFSQTVALDNYLVMFPKHTFIENNNSTILNQWQSLNTNAIVHDTLANTAFEGDLTKYRHFKEESTAVYLMANIDAQWFEKVVRGNLGVRWVTYDTQSNGYTTQIDINGQQSILPSTINHQFDEMLPSANLTFALDTDNLLRFSAGKVMSYSNFGLLVPDTLIDIKRQKLDLGNAHLQPNRAWQFDLSAEHYFSDEGLLGISVFYKKIDTYNEKITSKQSVDIGSATQIYQVTERVNGKEAWLKGLELNVQTPFSFLSGFWQHFGLFANATYSHSLRRMSTGEELRLPGQADFASNFILYWEKGAFSTRLAYNYRDSALSTRSGSNGVDIFEDSREYFDLALRYRFDNGLRLSFEALNLNKEPLYQYQNTVLHPIYASISQSRYYFGLGYTF